MKYMQAEWRGRLEHWEHTLKQDLYRPLGWIEFEGSLTMDHLSLKEAKKLTYQPMPAGTRWGHTYEYCWLRSKLKLPREAQGRRIALNLPTVAAFGEMEFWFALIKIVAIVALIVTGLVMIFTGFQHDAGTASFANLWNHGGMFPHGFLGFVAGFAYFIWKDSKKTKSN